MVWGRKYVLLKMFDRTPPAAMRRIRNRTAGLRPNSSRRVSAKAAIGLFAAALSTFILVRNAEPARSQELEPRVYSASPVDTNFVVGTWSNSKGTVPVSPSLPLTDVRGSINTLSLSFTHTFPFAGRTATWAVAVPYVGGSVTGVVFGKSQAGPLNGFPDLGLRFSVDLLSEGLSPAEFARRKPRPTLGVGITVTAPTGTYNPNRLINVGSNRWAFKPEVGVEVPMGKWFADFAAGLWLFGENGDFLRGQVLQQAPLGVYQVHTGYSFSPGQWLAFDVGYAQDGATMLGSARPINALGNSRYGLALSQPLGPGVSAKLSWSHWWRSGDVSQNFTTVGAALQYRWFNRP
jgi:outer membrane putative beta-barrel porin/alpha-amylase